MSATICSGNANTLKPRFERTESEGGYANLEEGFSSSWDGSTGYRVGIHNASSSRTIKKKNKPRKIPHKSIRKPKVSEHYEMVEDVVKGKGSEKGFLEKRKAIELPENFKPATRSKKEVVPNEESSTI